MSHPCHITTVSSVDVAAGGGAPPRLLYATMSPVLHLADLSRVLASSGVAESRPPDVAIDLSRGLGGRFRGGFGIYQARFAPGWAGSEAVAACSDNRVRVVDIASRSVVLSVLAHADDINAVCFADPAASANVFISASDDGMVRAVVCPARRWWPRSQLMPTVQGGGVDLYSATVPRAVRSSKFGIAARSTRRTAEAVADRGRQDTFRGISEA